MYIYIYTHTHIYNMMINNNVLLYSTGNYIQYPVIKHNRNDYEKRIYVCINKSLCCRKNTTLYQ